MVSRKGGDEYWPKNCPSCITGAVRVPPGPTRVSCIGASLPQMVITGYVQGLPVSLHGIDELCECSQGQRRAFSPDEGGMSFCHRLDRTLPARCTMGSPKDRSSGGKVKQFALPNDSSMAPVTSTATLIFGHGKPRLGVADTENEQHPHGTRQLQQSNDIGYLRFLDVEQGGCQSMASRNRRR